MYVVFLGWTGKTFTHALRHTENDFFFVVDKQIRKRKMRRIYFDFEGKVDAVGEGGEKSHRRPLGS